MNNSNKKASGAKGAKAQSLYNIYVTKYKRTKNLVKRCLEISDQCDLDIILIDRDKNTDRCREYHTSKGLTLPHLIKEKSSLKYERIFAGEEFPMDSLDKQFKKLTESNNDHIGKSLDVNLNVRSKLTSSIATQTDISFKMPIQQNSAIPLVAANIKQLLGQKRQRCTTTDESILS